MNTGYSKRSLVDKLGIKEGFSITLLNFPSGYEKTLGKLPPRVVIGLLEEGGFDCIQFFTKEKQELALFFPILKKKLKSAGMLWISWPKGISTLSTDLNENIIREIGLQNGMVDVKVIAVDETWSGLKFVYRLRDRK